MININQRIVRLWAGLGPRFMPFADAASPELPLSRLLRLSLFQVSVGMALVLMVGTLNRVMIVELGVPASLVGIMISLPVLFAPFRALIGHRSDTHRSALGWRRVPYMWQGSMLQFGGLAIMPFAVLVLSGSGESGNAPPWLGHVAAAAAFLMVGAGLHITQTVGLALATDLAPPESHPKVVGLMYVMLLLGTIVSALIFGALLEDFSPARLIQVIQGAAVVTIALNLVALWKQETRRPLRSSTPQSEPTSFLDTWHRFSEREHSQQHLLGIGLGTLAFTMQDVLLEPYGGQVLLMSVSETTKLTATLAVGGLLGFGLASRVLSQGADPHRMACAGVLCGLPAFLAVICAAPLGAPTLFAFGVLLIGFGGGLFSHGTLTSTMNLAPKHQTGLALGAWGAVQATAAGIGVALGGVIRDLVASQSAPADLASFWSGPATGYVVVYSLEMVLLLATLMALIPLVRPARTVAQKETLPMSQRNRLLNLSGAERARARLSINLSMGALMLAGVLVAFWPHYAASRQMQNFCHDLSVGTALASLRTQTATHGYEIELLDAGRALVRDPQSSGRPVCELQLDAAGLLAR